MSSPFPGMDPYLEAPDVWPEVHFHLIGGIHHVLQPQLIPRYHARVGVRVILQEPEAIILPDTAVVDRRPSEAGRGGTATLVAAPADEPVILTFPEEERQHFIEIYLTGSNSVVAVLEVLSPSNKSTAGGGRVEYEAKRERVLASTAHLVEIDLLRRGRPVFPDRALDTMRLPAYDYMACVSRYPHRARLEAYPFTVRDRLPRIRIPLREPDPDVVLDLPAAFARCYEEAVYDAWVDYSGPPSEPLRPEDEPWAEALLREAGLRPGA